MVECDLRPIASRDARSPTCRTFPGKVSEGGPDLSEEGVPENDSLHSRSGSKGDPIFYGRVESVRSP